MFYGKAIKKQLYKNRFVFLKRIIEFILIYQYLLKPNLILGLDLIDGL